MPSGYQIREYVLPIIRGNKVRWSNLEELSGAMVSRFDYSAGDRVRSRLALSFRLTPSSG